jgi:hypothetical protein
MVAGRRGHAILPFDEEIAQLWGKLRVPHVENPLDKQIAATALMYGLTVATPNVPLYEPSGVAVLNPFHVNDDDRELIRTPGRWLRFWHSQS